MKGKNSQTESSYLLLWIGLVLLLPAFLCSFFPPQVMATWLQAGYFPPPNTLNLIQGVVLGLHLLGGIAVFFFLIREKGIKFPHKCAIFLLFFGLLLSFAYQVFLIWADKVFTVSRIKLVSPTGKQTVYFEKQALGFSGSTVVYAHTPKSGNFSTERILYLPSTSDFKVVRLNWAKGDNVFGIFYREYVPKEIETLKYGYDFSKGKKIIEGIKAEYPPTENDPTPSLSGSSWKRLVENVTASGAVRIDLEKLLQ